MWGEIAPLGLVSLDTLPHPAKWKPKGPPWLRSSRGVGLLGSWKPWSKQHISSLRLVGALASMPRWLERVPAGPQSIPLTRIQSGGQGAALRGPHPTFLLSPRESPAAGGPAQRDNRSHTSQLPTVTWRGCGGGWSWSRWRMPGLCQGPRTIQAQVCSPSSFSEAAESPGS